MTQTRFYKRRALLAAMASLPLWERFSAARATPAQQMLLAGGDALASPSFFAPLVSTLVPTTAAGSPTATFARSGAMFTYIADWEGVLHEAIANEARFIGARRVCNLIAGSSEDFSNGSWTRAAGGTGVLPTVTAAFAPGAPVAAMNASRLQFDRAVGATNTSLMTQSVTLGQSSKDATFSVWLKANSGTPEIAVFLFDGAAQRGFLVTLDSTWRRYGFLVSTAVSGSCVFNVGLQGGSFTLATSSVTADVLISGAQVEFVSSHSNQNPGEYVSVGVASAPYHGAGVDAVKYFTTKNGNTMASNIVTEATGAAITLASGGMAPYVDANGPTGALIEPARTNLSLRAQNFTHAYWSYNNASNAANVDVAPNGYTVSSALSETAANGAHSYFHTHTKDSTVRTYTFSVYVKQANRHWVWLDIAFSGSEAYCHFDIANGVLGTLGSAGTYTNVSAGIAPAANGYYRCWLTWTSNTATTFNTQVGADIGDGVFVYAGSISVTAFYSFQAQLEEGAFPTSPIYTDAATVTRAVDSLSYAFASNGDASVGTAYAETRTIWSTAPFQHSGIRSLEFT